jgi:methionyl-tRNA formyltransferase
MRIVFMGTPAAAAVSLERLIKDGHEVAAVYTQPDRPAGRGKKVHESPVKTFAAGHGLNVIQPQKIKTTEALETFLSHEADAAIVVAYGRILPAPFLTAFPNGAINVHFSLLPKYRGAAPVNWAIINGERVTGVTTMQMDEGLDTGDVLMQAETPIGAGETAIELMERLSLLGADLLSETLDSIGGLVPRPQDHALATLAPLLRKGDGRIDWSMSAGQIAAQVRGFQPFPTAYTFLGDKKITVWRAGAAKRASPSEPGAVIEASGNRLSVACGKDSQIEIKELQLEGKRRMSTRDFLNGVKIHAGTFLG